MRNAFYALVAVVALLAAFFIGRYSKGYANSGMSSTSQKSCDEAAVRIIKNAAGDDYMDHYNAALGKCFVLVQSNGLVRGGQDMYTKTIITDAFARVEYGAFYGTKKRSAMQYTPALCRMLGDDGKWADCKTTPEWELFAKRMMKE